MTDAERLKLIRDIVNRQADDEALWCRAKYASEAYIQSALRKLHEVIEGVTGDQIAKSILE